ncbi:MAG TPA: hypothetical protein DCQ87_02940, partial [Lachnospiraceae bacterium]|nr:hypothetical protein [Lachnospiraceae bacterium]
RHPREPEALREGRNALPERSGEELIQGFVRKGAGIIPGLYFFRICIKPGPVSSQVRRASVRMRCGVFL